MLGLGHNHASATQLKHIWSFRNTDTYSRLLMKLDWIKLILLTKNFVIILYNSNRKYAAACISKFLELSLQGSSGDTSKLKKHQVAQAVRKLYTVVAEPRTWLKKVYFKFDRMGAFTFSTVSFA